jgi:hypothetical protein
MAGRTARSLLFVGSTLLAGCVMPFGGEPSSPEFDAVRRDVQHAPMERIHVHDACVAADPTRLVACMREAGYRLVTPAEDPRASDCRQLVDTGVRPPPAYCFMRAASATGD